MRAAFRRRRTPTGKEPRSLKTSFGPWESLHESVLAVCHPEWRGVRTATYAFGDPVVETPAADRDAAAILTACRDRRIEVLVVHGFPPGADVLLRLAHEAGLSTRVVLHSSMAQHGAEAGEAAVADRVVDLTRQGVVDRVGFVKAGMAEVFQALGIDALHTPNRAPTIPDFEPIAFEEDRVEIGVFAEPFWRKNVVTQLGAVALIPNARAHVMRKPDVRYLDGIDIVEHGELPWEEFVRLQGSMDLNLYVTLSESHPMTPVESYLSGVPCLFSRTSDLFRDDDELWDTTTIAEADDPSAIARAGSRLLQVAPIERARAWIGGADITSRNAWSAFTEGD
jgi:hypothetical protein